MIPMDGIEIFNAALQITENIAYYVPRNVNTDQGPNSHVTSAKHWVEDLRGCSQHSRVLN